MEETKENLLNANERKIQPKEDQCNAIVKQEKLKVRQKAGKNERD